MIRFPVFLMALNYNPEWMKINIYILYVTR